MAVKKLPSDAKKTLFSATSVLHDHHAIDLSAYDVHLESGYTDAILVATAMSKRHIQALAETLSDRFDLSSKAIEGREASEWVVVDLSDVVVHLFLSDAREAYRFDRLYGDSEVIDLSPILSQENSYTPSMAQQAL